MKNDDGNGSSIQEPPNQDLLLLTEED